MKRPSKVRYYRVGYTIAEGDDQYVSATNEKQAQKIVENEWPGADVIDVEEVTEKEFDDNEGN